MEKTGCFDPAWRDDIFDERALALPLMLPGQTEPNNRIWVKKKVIWGEEIFGTYQEYKKPRIITAILKKSPRSDLYVTRDLDGREVDKDHPVYDLIFPPKAWMSDTAQELCSMYMAAKEAGGDILMSGLGLGIYPQMALVLQKPVDSITIVENNPDIIEITTDSWVKNLDPETRGKIKILERSYEEYAETATHTFDTIYLDLWEDSDPRYLPHMNYLVNLSKPLCKPGGKIRCWSYAITVDAFIRSIGIFEAEDIDIEKIPQDIDPLLKRYAQWRSKQNSKRLTPGKCEKKAGQLAHTVTATLQEYDRDKCFSPFAVTRAEAYMKLPIFNAARRQ
jgi:predicted O-methyltransferase YrrM